MPTYLHPGVYIEEIPSGAKPIEGVSTSIAAFIGFASRGPIGEPVLIQSWDDYVDRFGGVTSPTDAMGLAVNAFYLNGGRPPACPIRRRRPFPGGQGARRRTSTSCRFRR